MASTHLSLRIDTDASGVDDEPIPPTPDTRFSARLVGSGARERAVSFSQGLPSLRISTAGNSEKQSASRDVVNVTATQGSQKAKNESRKLLAHLLDQLQRRPMPSSTYDAYDQAKGGIGISAVVRTVKSAVGSKSKGSVDERRPSLSTSDDEDADVEEAAFYTDGTLDLMSQLKDVFLIASLQKWNLFSDTSGTE